MELAGIAAGGNMRSCFSDFDIKNAAELEAHVNMNAIAARMNFEKYYKERLNDVSKLWRDVRRRMDVRDVLEVPACLLDVGTSKFDYSTIGVLFHDKLQEKMKNNELRKAGDGSVEALLTINIKANMDDPYKLVIKGCDYTNVDKVVTNLVDNTEVTHLSLANNGLEADDCDSLAKLIEGNRVVVSLDLSNNKIGGEGIAKLATALAKNTTLTDLDLGANNLAKSAAKALAEAISVPTCALSRLQLSGNALGIYGAEELGVGLRANRSIKALGLQNNNIGNDGANKLLEILPPKSMPIDEVTADSLLPVTERKYNTSLVQISVDANRIDDALALAVSNGTWLNEQVQMRHHLTKLEEEARTILEDVDPEMEALRLVFASATQELQKELDEKKKKAAAVPAAKPAGKAPPGKVGSKVPPKAAPANRSASKSPEKPANAKAAPAPAASGKVKAAAASGAKNPSPKRSGK